MLEKPKSDLDKKRINLTINLDSDNNIYTESICTIFKINDNNYTLNCEFNENIEVDLQNAISFINDEEILLVNFDSGNNTIITNNNNKNPTNKRYISKKSNGLKPGTIVAIILALAVTVATVVGLAIYMKNQKNINVIKTETGRESIIQILK